MFHIKFFYNSIFYHRILIAERKINRIQFGYSQRLNVLWLKLANLLQTNPQSLITLLKSFPYSINSLQFHSVCLKQTSPINQQTSISNDGWTLIFSKVQLHDLQLEILLNFTSIIIIFKIMNFFFTPFQPNHYNVQVFNASSKNASVSELWDSTENWQNQIENKGNKNMRHNQISFANQGASQTYSEPHSFAITDFGGENIQLTKKYDKQFGIVNCHQINKNELYLVLRSPQSILGNNGNKNGLFAKMVKQSFQYDQVIKSNNKKYNDKSFSKQIQFVDVEGKKHELEWKDIKEIGKQIKKQIKIISYPFRSTDVAQGTLGDCYFAAAIAALANSSKPQRIFRLFSSIQLNQQGIFSARLMFKGILQQVVIDSTFPIIKNTDNQEEGMKLLGCSPNRNGQIYTMVLQKCWAKLWKSYQTIDGGFPHQALHALSGAPTKNYILSTETDTEQNKSKFFNQILNFHEIGYVMCAATSQTETMYSVDVVVTRTKQKTKIRLAQSHIYCVSQISFNNNQKNVKIYNPWGYNYNIDNQRIQGQVQISWQRFIKQFQYLTVCKLHDNANYLYHQIKFQSKKLKFIELSVRKATKSYFAITISETDKKQKINDQGEHYLNITYIVVKVIKSPEGEQYELVTIRSQYKFSDHYLELHDIQEGEYLIAVYIADEQIKQELTFGVYSEAYFGFKQKENVGSKFEQNFLPNVLRNYHQNAPQQKNIFYPVANNKKIWITIQMLNHRQARLGYYLLHVSQGEKAYQISLGKKGFQQVGISVLYPYNKDCFKLVAEPGFESIATLLITDIKKYNQTVLHKKDLYKLIEGKPQYKK